MPNTERKAHVVSFDCNKGEELLVRRIVRRADMAGLNEHQGGMRWMRKALAMDLIAAHANGCPLDFEKLLRFDEFNFAHDVAGIQRHIDRKTGGLRDYFVPRCAKPDPA